MESAPGLRLTVVWFDADLVELRVEANNGQFAGTADCYACHGKWCDLAQAIDGFPASVPDHRTFEIGTLDTRSPYWGGGIQLELFTRDATGHSLARVRLRRGPPDSGRPHEFADFTMPVEAAAIDAFVRELRAMELERGSSAHLVGAFAPPLVPRN